MVGLLSLSRLSPLGFLLSFSFGKTRRIFLCLFQYSWCDHYSEAGEQRGD